MRIDPTDLIVAIVGLGLVVLLFAWGALRAPSPEDARRHVETDAIRQTQIERERNRRYAATRKLDSLEAALSDCRMERAKLEATK